MKAVNLLTVFLFTSTAAVAQNVGVGTPTPSEKLDVAGSINVTGTIKANGAAGTAGQVLMSTGSGLSWGSLLNYKKCVVFQSAGGSGTWTVPAGVTEVMVEVWGAGSGGTTNAGGTSGGYARTVQSVTAGTGLTYAVGSGSAGSSGAATSTTDGGFSQVTFSAGFIRALGGGGVASTFIGIPVSGTASGLDNAYFMFGNTGTTKTFSFGQRTSTIYIEVIKYGNGGAPVGMLNAVAPEGELLRNENGSQVFRVGAISSRLPGSGGASGINFGYEGGPGMVAIWFYN